MKEKEVLSGLCRLYPNSTHSSRLSPEMNHHPLASFPIASTSDIDEAQSILSSELLNLRFKKVRDSRSFRLEMNGVHLGKTMLGYNQFDTDTVVDVGQVDSAIVLVIGVGSPTVVHIDREPVVCTEQGAIVSPSRRVINHRPAGSGVFVIRARFHEIEERFREVMDRRPGKPIVFDSRVVLTDGVGGSARRLLNFVVDEIHRDSAVLENPLLRAGFDEMLLNALLGLPNNYSDELMGGRQVPVAPAHVRRAEEFLEAHATEPITISDLVAECNCSRNALFSAFRKFRDYTPNQFLTNSRLRAARASLQSPSPSETITSIAFASGFSHLGRFSEAYRRRFGELPSEAMHRAGSSIET